MRVCTPARLARNSRPQVSCGCLASCLKEALTGEGLERAFVDHEVLKLNSVDVSEAGLPNGCANMCSVLPRSIPRLLGAGRLGPQPQSDQGCVETDPGQSSHRPLACARVGATRRELLFEAIRVRRRPQTHASPFTQRSLGLALPAPGPAARRARQLARSGPSWRVTSCACSSATSASW